MISDSVHLLEETRKFGQENAGGNWVALEDVLIQALEGDGPLIDSLTAAVSTARKSLAATVGRAVAQRIIGGGLSLFCRHICNLQNLTSYDVMVDHLYDYMVANAIYVQSRQFTFGSPTPDGGNVGNGVMLRLTKDSRNFDLEAQHAEAKRAFCIRDQNSGTYRHEEVFKVEGAAPGPDALQVSGSGAISELTAISAKTSLAKNASFSSFGGTAAAPTSITSWESSVAVSATNYVFDGTNYYREYPRETTPYALQVNVTANLSQDIADAGRSLNPAVPYMLQVAWNRAIGAATGSLTVRMGSASTTVAVAAQAGWQLIRVPTSPGQNCWLRNFNEDDLDISIEWTRTGGTLLIDDVLLAPGTKIDNSWYWLIGGTTPFLYGEFDGDFFTWTDTVVDAIIQRWFWRAFGRHLPCAAGSGVTWPDP